MIASEALKLLTETLERYQGGSAKLWLYIQSLKQLHVQLMRPNEDLSTDLICYGCLRLQAQTSWEDIAIQVKAEDSETYEVVDPNNGFLVVCKLIRIIPNVTEPLV
jgi:hypothetical protein